MKEGRGRRGGEKSGGEKGQLSREMSHYRTVEILCHRHHRIVEDIHNVNIFALR